MGMEPVSGREIDGSVPSADGYWQVASNYTGRLRRLALRLLRGDEEGARELTQQTLVKSAECDGVGERGDAWPLFRRVMLNAFIDRTRQRRRETALIESEMITTVETDIEAHLLTDRLTAAIRSLRSDQIRLLSAVYGEGYSQIEAADRLGLTEEAVKQRLKRARARLREILPPMEDLI